MCTLYSSLVQAQKLEIMRLLTIGYSVDLWIQVELFNMEILLFVCRYTKSLMLRHYIHRADMWSLSFPSSAKLSNLWMFNFCFHHIWHLTVTNHRERDSTSTDTGWGKLLVFGENPCTISQFQLMVYKIHEKLSKYFVAAVDKRIEEQKNAVMMDIINLCWHWMLVATKRKSRVAGTPAHLIFISVTSL